MFFAGVRPCFCGPLIDSYVSWKDVMAYGKLYKRDAVFVLHELELQGYNLAAYWPSTEIQLLRYLARYS